MQPSTWAFFPLLPWMTHTYRYSHFVSARKHCLQHPFFLYLHNCSVITKQYRYFAEQSNTQLFYLVSLAASNLPSYPRNLSEKFLSYLNVQFWLPVAVNPRGSSPSIYFRQHRCCQLLEVQPHHWFCSWRSFCIKMRVNQYQITQVQSLPLF